MIAAIGLLLALATPALPVHATALARDGALQVVRLDAVTGMLAAQTRAVRIEPPLALPRGTGVDAFLDRSQPVWRLEDADVAARFVPGLPETGKVQPIDVGSAIPHTQLVDQQGHLIDLAAVGRGKVLVLAFMYTRCADADECPLLSAKFAQLQAKLDARRFRLAEITIDPSYDSPWVMANYARRFGAHPQTWSMLTGKASEIGHLLDRFGISSLRAGGEKLLHNDKVFLADPKGRVADIVQTTGFSAGALAAQAQHLAGLASSPFGRLELAIVASAIALCGGSQFAGVVLLETVLFLIIAVFAFAALSWIARKLMHNA